MRAARSLGYDSVSELVDQLAGAYERNTEEGTAFVDRLFAAAAEVSR